MRAPAIAIALSCLTACASPSTAPVSATPQPAALTLEDAKAALLGARHLWKDPDSIRDTRIGQPYSSGCRGHAEHLLQQFDACVCIATNAKNSFGGYTGLRPQVALLKGRSVLDMIPARSIDQCSAMVPWPEFDGRPQR